MKSVIKEIFIMIILCVAIFLVLGILFYEYIPSSKIVPNKVAYETPSNVSEEISSKVDEKATPVTITYELGETEINNSKKNGDYDSGKQNPFQAYQEENKDETQNNTSSNNTTNNINTATQGTSNTNSSNTSGYLPDKGTK